MTDLLDARGYEIELKTDAEEPIQIVHLGAVVTEHPELHYDEDAYVVSRLENIEFTKKQKTALKDSGIRRSGLHVQLAGKPGSRVLVTVCGEKLGRMTLDRNGIAEKVLDVTMLCQKEKEYLERIHRILYLLLSEVDRICSKHEISYFLVFGGLLGVLRFEDIIPWDDDVDIAMTREDFERFKKIAPQELSPDFQYLDCSDLGKGTFLDFLCRILYVKEPVPVNVFRKVGGKCRKEIENHLPLDIYILDKASDNPKLHKLQMAMVRGVYGLSMGHRAYVNKAEYAGRDRLTKIAVQSLSAAGKLLPMPALFWMHDRVSQMFQKKETKDYFMSNGYLPFIHTRYQKEWFDSCTRVALGEIKVNAPADIEAYLKRAYYDYYHYLPFNKRVPGHSPDADGVF